MSKVMIKTDENNNIIECRMDWLINQTTNDIASWTELEETNNRHKSNEYNPVINDNGLYVAKYIGGNRVLKTESELLAELNTGDNKLKIIKMMIVSILGRQDIKDIQSLLNFNSIGVSKNYNKKTNKIQQANEQAWFEWIENVATFLDNGFDINDYTLDPTETSKTLITMAIFGAMPDVPDVYQNLIE